MGLGYSNPQIGGGSGKRLSTRESVSMKIKNDKGDIDNEKGDKKGKKEKDRLYAPPFLSRTRHPGIMRNWALSCPPLGTGGAASPLTPKNGMDRVRFVRRLEEEGSRVFAHVNASVGFLEVTPLQVRADRTYSRLVFSNDRGEELFNCLEKLIIFLKPKHSCPGEKR
jgi:hypothetical protein